MRDLARTVAVAPPLRLTAEAAATSRARAARRGRGSRRWSRGAPVLAAAAVVAVAVALVIVRSTPNGRVTSPSPTASTATAVKPLEVGGVPEYYVAWMQADHPYLSVGNTLTGKMLGLIPSPHGVYLDHVYGASADDRTFLVSGYWLLSSPTSLTMWYLVHIDPGSAKPVLLTRLLVLPGFPAPAGAALSPDGKEVAVAVNSARPSLRVYSLQSGRCCTPGPLRLASSPRSVSAGQLAVHPADAALDPGRQADRVRVERQGDPGA